MQLSFLYFISTRINRNKKKKKSNHISDIKKKQKETLLPSDLRPFRIIAALADCQHQWPKSNLKSVCIKGTSGEEEGRLKRETGRMGKPTNIVLASSFARGLFAVGVAVADTAPTAATFVFLSSYVDI